MKEKSDKIMIYATPVCNKTKSYDLDSAFCLFHDEKGNIPFKIAHGGFDTDINHIHANQDSRRFFEPLKYSQYLRSNYQDYKIALVYGLLVDPTALKINVSNSAKWQNELFNENEIENIRHESAKMYQGCIQIYEIPAKSIKIIGMYCNDFETGKETIYLNDWKEQLDETTKIKKINGIYQELTLPVNDTDHFLSEIRESWTRDKQGSTFDAIEKKEYPFEIKPDPKILFKYKLTLLAEQKRGTDTDFHFSDTTPKIK